MYVVVFHTFHFVGINVCSPCWWVLNSAAGTEVHAKSMTVGLSTSCVCRGGGGGGGWVMKTLVPCTQFKITFPTYGSHKFTYVTIRTFFFSNFAQFCTKFTEVGLKFIGSEP